MRKPLTIAALLVLVASPAFALQAVVSWTNPTDASITGINVLKAASPTGTFTAVNPSVLAPGTSTFTDTAITINTQVCYEVQTVNGLGSTATSAVCGTPNAPLPASGITIIFKP